jgi:hypothetical protein
MQGAPAGLGSMRRGPMLMAQTCAAPTCHAIHSPHRHAEGTGSNAQHNTHSHANTPTARRGDEARAWPAGPAGQGAGCAATGAAGLARRSLAAAGLARRSLAAAGLARRSLAAAGRAAVAARIAFRFMAAHTVCRTSPAGAMLRRSQATQPISGGAGDWSRPPTRQGALSWQRQAAQACHSPRTPPTQQGALAAPSSPGVPQTPHAAHSAGGAGSAKQPRRATAPAPCPLRS